MWVIFIHSQNQGLSDKNGQIQNKWVYHLSQMITYFKQLNSWTPMKNAYNTNIRCKTSDATACFFFFWNLQDQNTWRTRLCGWYMNCICCKCTIRLTPNLSLYMKTFQGMGNNKNGADTINNGIFLGGRIKFLESHAKRIITCNINKHKETIIVIIITNKYKEEV